MEAALDNVGVTTPCRTISIALQGLPRRPSARVLRRSHIKLVISHVGCQWDPRDVSKGLKDVLQVIQYERQLLLP